MYSLHSHAHIAAITVVSKINDSHNLQQAFWQFRNAAVMICRNKIPAAPNIRHGNWWKPFERYFGVSYLCFCVFRIIFCSSSCARFAWIGSFFSLCYFLTLTPPSRPLVPSSKVVSSDKYTISRVIISIFDEMKNANFLLLLRSKLAANARHVYDVAHIYT